VGASSIPIGTNTDVHRNAARSKRRLLHQCGRARSQVNLLKTDASRLKDNPHEPCALQRDTDRSRLAAKHEVPASTPRFCTRLSQSRALWT